MIYFIKEKIKEHLLIKDDTDIREVADFINFTKEYLGINDDIKIQLSFKHTPDIRTTGYYSLDKFIKVYVGYRLFCDFEKTIAHELTHHKQLLDGKLNNPAKDGEDDSPLEAEANSVAGTIIRKWGKLHPEIYEKYWKLDKLIEI